MKKLTIVVLLLVGMTAGINAQYKQHDIQLSYGFLTYNVFRDIAETLLINVLTLGFYEKDHQEYNGAYFLSYDYFLRDRLALGACLGFETVTGALFVRNDQRGTFKESNTILALEGDFRWVKRNAFQMYTGAGIGFNREKTTGEIWDNSEADDSFDNYMVYQFNLLGMRFGKSFGGFMELGFGYKGLLNFGFSYQIE